MSMGGSAPAGASTNQPRAGASVYTPTNQGNVDIALQSLFGGLGSPYITGGFGGQGLNVNPSLTPAGVAYTGAQPWIGASGGGVADPNDPFYQLALQSANNPAWTSGALNTVASNIYSGLDPALAQATGATQPAIGGLESAIQYGVGSGLPQAIANAQGLQPDIASLGSGLSSLFGTTLPQVQGVSGTMLGDAGTGLGQVFPRALGASNALYGAGNTALGAAMPYALGGAADLSRYGDQILGTAFDPQQALYDQTQNQVAQEAAAAAAQAGLGGTAYGASIGSNALENFNINWRNQQLVRQAQGLAAAEPAFQEAAVLPGAAATSAIAPFQTAGALPGAALSSFDQPITTAAGLPGGVMQQGGQIGQQIAALSQAAGALPADLAARLGSLGIQAAGMAYSPLQGYSQLGGTLAPFAQQGAAIGALPLGVQTGQTSNALQALGSGANLGTQQYVLPQQLANDLQSYLGLGQAASGLSGYLGNLGLQQQQNAFSGIGGALGLLGNPFSSSASAPGLLGGTLGNPFSATSGGLLGGALSGGLGAGSGLASAADVAAAGLPAGSYFAPLTGALGADATFGGGGAAAGGGLGKLGAAAPALAL